ncbi:hypothetical protein GGI15_001718 [Coemansia interrupta]|uniref:Mid2 domain-containing protein n=1 Tax=Coemansia interrupta TaxID=1126814 RepID=A0A9W8LNG8_9FUNG|nr:hypothetical protein GGI15_001718 [Coemansia interrupta]
MCKDQWMNYYTWTVHFLAYAANVLGHSVDIMYNGTQANSTAVPESEIIFNQPDDVDMAGKLLVGGNLFGRQASVSSTSSSEQTALPTESDLESDLASDTLISESDESGSSGLDKTAKIVIGVVVPVVAIIIAVCVFVGYRLWRNKRNDFKQRAHAEEMHLREMANDLVIDQSVQPAALNPPPYSADDDNIQIHPRQSVMSTATPMSTVANNPAAAPATANLQNYEYTDKK